MTNNQNAYEKELIKFLKIPSISAQKKHHKDCLNAARFVQEMLVKRGFEAEIRSTGDPQDSFPVVLGKYEPKGSKYCPTLLVYGHYDVQPPDPLDLWITPPFEPHIKEGKIYARGATDNKGQIFALICGLGEALKNNNLPLKILFLIEGEEEIGSPHLDPFVMKNRSELECDCVLISDSPQLGPGQPAICYGLKGLTYFEIQITGPKRDLHSGSFGGLVYNPALCLTKILASLMNDQGKITVPGFYDDVLELSPEEKEMMSSLPYDENAVKKDLGIKEFFGEMDYSPRERRWGRPTFDIHGLTSGYQGEGAKTVIPSWAKAKFGFRLVANQKPDPIEKLLKAYLKSIVPEKCQWELQSFHSACPVTMDFKHPLMKAAESAIKDSFGKKPVYIREGGSIPVVSTFQRDLNALPILIGLGLPTDGAHAPNEHLTLADFHRGRHMASVLPQYLSEQL